MLLCSKLCVVLGWVVLAVNGCTQRQVWLCAVLVNCFFIKDRNKRRKKKIISLLHPLDGHGKVVEHVVAQLCWWLWLLKREREGGRTSGSV